MGKVFYNPVLEIKGRGSLLSGLALHEFWGVEGGRAVGMFEFKNH